VLRDNHDEDKYEDNRGEAPCGSLRRCISRRELLLSTAAGAATLAFTPRLLLAGSSYTLPEPTVMALAKSPFVYVSPLHASGKESRCHGEAWFFADGHDVVIATAVESWKSRAVHSGRDRARIWVGDFGRGKKVGERYRAGATFLARASIDKDPAAFQRMMKAFGKRYAEEWGKWEPRFQKGYDAGSRVLIRYAPIGA
jgi:hypothetical protein